MRKWELTDDVYGELLPYIEDKNVTDIRWDGENLWIDDLQKGKYCTEIKLSKDFTNQFAQRISDLSNSNYSSSVPILEGETDSLRIAFIHESVTDTGMAFTIRKTEAECRLTDEIMVEKGYCDSVTIDLLTKLVKARCSFIVTGDTGSGKTELIKWLIKSIPDKTTTITVEDNFEIRAKALRPTYDCTEIKVTENFTPDMAIKSSLRQNAKWLILSEARGKEVFYLVQAASSGCSAATTVHAFDVRDIPDRFSKMIGGDRYIINDVYSYFDIGILIKKEESERGITRSIHQICLFENTDSGNKTHMILDNGKYVGNYLPEKIKKKLELYGHDVPHLFEGEVNL